MTTSRSYPLSSRAKEPAYLMRLMGTKGTGPCGHLKKCKAIRTLGAQTRGGERRDIHKAGPEALEGTRLK